MGVRGFQSYLKSRNDILELYNLQNTYVVIDGLNIMYHMFEGSSFTKDIRYDNKSLIAYTRYFGGDYDLYQHLVTQFFENLLECNVTPIVIFDGVNTIKSKEDAVKKFTYQTFKKEYEENCSHSPLLLRYVFNMVLRKLKIKFFRCLLETYDTIISISKILDCPIISNNMDFCFQEVKLIILSTFYDKIQNSISGKVYPCKIFYAYKLVEKFRPLKSSLLPLANMLLQDVPIKNCSIFFLKEDIEIFHEKIENSNWNKFDPLFRWLSNFQSPDEAIQGILVLIPTDHREQFERIAKKYIDVTSTLSKYAVELLKLNGNGVFLERKNGKESSTLGNVMEQKAAEIEDEDFLSEKEILPLLPEWFIRDVMSNEIDPFFIDVIMKSLFTLRSSVGDRHYSCVHELSTQIIDSIISLLKADGNDEEPTASVELMMFEKGGIALKKKVLQKASITLENMRSVDMSERKKIIDDVLNLHGKKTLDYVPEEWKLYVGAAIFWMKQDTLPKRNRIHLNCLLLCMLFGIIDRTIGFERCKLSFRRKFGMMPSNVCTSFKTIDDKDVKSAINFVSKNDCIIAASFFLDHFQVRGKLCEYPWHAKTVVHVFGQFQCCLLHLEELNDLLGLPYVRTPIGELFNGTLLYNLYDKFYESSDINGEIKNIFKMAPGLLAVFESLRNVITSHLDDEN